MGFHKAEGESQTLEPHALSWELIQWLVSVWTAESLQEKRNAYPKPVQLLWRTDQHTTIIARPLGINPTSINFKLHLERFRSRLCHGWVEGF